MRKFNIRLFPSSLIIDLVIAPELPGSYRAAGATRSVARRYPQFLEHISSKAYYVALLQPLLRSLEPLSFMAAPSAQYNRSLQPMS